MTVDSESWTVYIIRASDDSLYTGITTDLARRLQQHREGAGAKYFHAGRQPEQVVYQEEVQDRATASKREACIKKLSRAEKLALCRLDGER